ncbi:MAG: hypothetical protein IPL75_16930 [Acidobacteria bacterium]|nr:hypothetical protein [Acidobacteriota bacterium]
MAQRPSRAHGIRGGMTYDVSADGQKLVIDDGASDNARSLTLVQHWTALLAQMSAAHHEVCRPSQKRRQSPPLR